MVVLPELAMIQTRWVQLELQRLHPDIDIEIVGMTTVGDRILNVSLSKIGEKSLFTKELEVALAEGVVDMVVHSLKDLPTVLPEGMVIGAVCEREDARDAVVMRPDHCDQTLDTLAEGSCVGTSSVRRTAQLKRGFPHLRFESIRGNLNTRLRKLDRGADGGDVVYDAIILAAAGVQRMGWEHRITTVLDSDVCMYAVGQGALAVECRVEDAVVLRLLAPLRHWQTTVRCVAERSLLRTLEGGCSTPVAVQSHVHDDTLTLSAGVWSLDGRQRLTGRASVCVGSVQAPRGAADRAEVPERAGDHCGKRPAVQEAADGGSDSVKKPRVAAGSCVGVHRSVEFSDQMSLAQQLGESVSQQLVKLGARAILTAARAENGGT